MLSARAWATVPSAEKSKELELRFCSGKVDSKRAEGVHVSQRLEDDADSKA